MCKTKSKVRVWPWTLTPDSASDRDHKYTTTTSWPIGGTALAAASGHTPIVAPGSPTSRCDSTSPTTLHHFSQTMSSPTGSLVEVMDVLNRSMTNQYAILQETLRQSQSASKEHYLCNAQSCDGKNLQEFGMWPDEVFQIATICDKIRTPWNWH